MQTTLINNKITKEKIITLTQYNKIVNNNEYLLFADNILEGIELLNELTFSQNYLSFYAIVYEPMDQPIYIFEDSNFYPSSTSGSVAIVELYANSEGSGSGDPNDGSSVYDGVALVEKKGPPTGALSSNVSVYGIYPSSKTSIISSKK